MSLRPALVTLHALALLPVFALAATPDDQSMQALALHSGCTTCHAIASGTRGPGGRAPIGPPWQDVADKYRNSAGAEDQLLTTVMKGSNPYDSHWHGKVTGLAMPPNAVAIQSDDARQLVRWVLALKK